MSELEKGGQPDDSSSDRNPNLITWDGPDDTANPKNWTFKRKWLATGLVSLIAFMTPIASTMIAPASSTLAIDLDVSSTLEIQLIFSIFFIGFIIGPFLLAPMSETYGRVIVLQLANIFFLIFNLACGFAYTKREMMAFRLLSGLGACAPQTIGGGVLGDLFRKEERGMAVALYTLGPILAPSLGPLLGAWIAEKSTWRWDFYSVTIFGAVVQILIYFTLPETFGPRILYWKASKLRRETGNQKLRTEYELEDRNTLNVLKQAFTRPLVLLFTQPIVQFLALYLALIYGILILVLSTFFRVFTEVYGQSLGIAGLNYIALMLGQLLGVQAGGRCLDIVYRRLSRKSPGRPEYRVPLMFPAIILASGGIFMYGWSVQARTHWIVPDMGGFIFSFGITFLFTPIQAYIIDAYTTYAASALGATAVTRSVTGFAFPLFAVQMYDAVGYGWGNSILGFAMAGIGLSGASVLWFYGDKLRARSPFAASKDGE